MKGVLMAAIWSMTVLSSSVATGAQPPPAEVEQLVKYSQCIRANGVPDFPDPGPDGRMQIKLDPKNGARLEAAQQACKDKRPRGMAAMDQPMTPERMQSLIGFARCVRGKGVNGFPDPSPDGSFEIKSSMLDLSARQAQQALESCRQSNPIDGLMIRMTRPQ
jgi:hypothetical protein